MCFQTIAVNCYLKTTQGTVTNALGKVNLCDTSLSLDVYQVIGLVDVYLWECKS